ncbi:MAG: hypothetical protein ACRDD1_14635, partial [Planctomycetia bacterium]
GLTAVVATQLWRHLYFGGGLCDLPTWTPPALERTPAVPTAVPPPLAVEPTVEPTVEPSAAAPV